MFVKMVDYKYSTYLFLQNSIQLKNFNIMVELTQKTTISPFHKANKPFPTSPI